MNNNGGQRNEQGYMECSDEDTGLSCKTQRSTSNDTWKITSNQKSLTAILESIFGCTTNQRQRNLLSHPQFYSSETPILVNISSDVIQDHSVNHPLDKDAKTLKRQDITVDNCDVVLTHAVKFFIEASCPLHLVWMNDCYNRCNVDFVGTNVALRIAYADVKDTNLLDVNELKDMIIRFAALCLSCPEYFVEEGDTSSRLDQLNAEAVMLLSEHANTSGPFLSLVWENVINNNAYEFERIVALIVEAFATKLSQRSLQDTRYKTMEALCLFVSSQKKISSVVGRIVYPDSNANVDQPKRLTAWFLANETLLGHVLRATPLDEGLFLHDLSRCVRVKCFPPIVCKNHRSLSKAIDSVRENVLEVVTTANAFIIHLCRNGAREECLQWISRVIQRNQKRIQQSILSQLEYFSFFSASMETFALQYHGLSSTGFNLNLFWVLLKLLDPVKLKKVHTLDIKYLLSKEASLRLEPFTHESRLCSLDELKELELTYRESSQDETASKFPTQIFFLALLGLQYLLRPAIKEFSDLRDLIHRKQAEASAGNVQTPGRRSYDDLVSGYICYTTILGHPSFLSSWWRFTNLFVTFLCYNFAQDPDNDSSPKHDEIFMSLTDDLSRVALLFHKMDKKGEPSCTVTGKFFMALPYCVLESFSECIKVFLSIPFMPSFPTDPMITCIVKSLPSVNEDLLAAFFLFIFRSDTVIRSPHCRWSCGYEPFSDLHNHPLFCHRIDNMTGVIKWLIPTLIKAFIDVQKEGYYVRIRRRLSFTIHLGRLLELGPFVESLKGFVENKNTHDIFVRFLAMLFESMTWLLEEGMATLAEIKKKESTEVASSQPSGVSSVAVLPTRSDTQSNESENNNQDDYFDARSLDQGHNVSEISLEELERLCKSLTDAGLRTIQVVNVLVKIFGDVITHSPILLPQVITSLNCCMDRLVGPKCLELKVSSFEKYNFNPKALLATTIMIYISLANFDVDDKQQIIHAVCNDTRYFKLSVFKKTYHVAKREEILSTRDLEAFSQLILSLEAKSEQLIAEEEWFSKIWDDIPDEFKDPIMDSIMEDPVLLPTSGHIMDRKTIERHLMTEEFDPYNRMPLKTTDLIPQGDLRLRIQETLQNKRTDFAHMARMRTKKGSLDSNTQ